jgi:hypothetical protein
MRQYKDLAVKDPRMGVFNLNSLRADCKMSRWVLRRFWFEQWRRSTERPVNKQFPHLLKRCGRQSEKTNDLIFAMVRTAVVG